MPVKTEGWYGPPSARRFHYFRAGRSLCGKWAVLAPADHVPWDCAYENVPGDCAECARLLAKAQV
jgi:hypothetical protein